jgi:hypothetical protein
MYSYVECIIFNQCNVREDQSRKETTEGWKVNRKILTCIDTDGSAPLENVFWMMVGCGIGW